jgi:NAD dependent epimerase/dehydratase family enzyme
VARAWESAAQETQLAQARGASTRVVLLRSAMVMSADKGGIFDVLLGLVQRGLGSKAGDGRQFVSWIHHRDFTRAISHLIEHENICGPVNLAAPHPLPHAEFMRALRHAWGTKIGLPATNTMLEIGTFLMHTETELVLKSRRVVPQLLLQNGFEFEFPTWPEAAQNLCEESRAARLKNEK